MTKRYERPVPSYWVFTRVSWFIFFLREITCIFVGVFAITFLMLVRSVQNGPDAYGAFLECLRSPGVIAYHCVALVAVIWHTITWFTAAPKAMRPRMGDKLVPASAIIGGHYGLWFALSAFVMWVLL